MMAVLFAAILQASLPMRTLDKGINSNIDGSRQIGALNAADWEKLWTQHAGERMRPSVDFTREVVVAVFLGSRPTAGFSVEIVRVRQEDTQLVVSYKETRPAPDGVAAQILTSPYHIVAVPRGTATGVRFERVG